MVPGSVGFLLGGNDKNGHRLYEIGCDGSAEKADDYRADGSGSVFALGVLEALYVPDMTLEEGVKVAVRAISAALQRDIYTGNGIDVVTITASGVNKVLSKEVNAVLKA